MLKILKYILLASVVSFSLIQPAQAQYSSAIVAAITALQNKIVELYQSASSALTKITYEKNPNLPSTMTGNIGGRTATTDAQDKNNALTLEQIKNLLTGSAKTLEMATIPASDSQIPTQDAYNFGAPTNTPDLTKGNANFSANSLLEPMVYPKKGKQNPAEKLAKNFVNFITGMGTPIPTASLNGLTPKQVSKLQADAPAYQNYLIALRSFIAAQSVGLSNLNLLIAERLPSTGLGTKAGVKDAKGTPVPDASPLQVDAYLANRRVENPQWYADMAAAAPATVARETLNVLAEIRQEMFKQRLLLERLLVTQTVMQLHNLEETKALLQQKVKDAQSTIDSAKKERQDNEI